MDERTTIQTIKGKLTSKVIQSDVFTITPKVAEFLLNLNWPQNRKLVESTVKSYTASIKHGNWKLNGMPIVVSSKGNMLNGQHRLFAVIEAEADIQSVIQFGIDEDTFDTMDCGTNRPMWYLSDMSPPRAAALNFIIKMTFGNHESSVANLHKMAVPYGEYVDTLIRLQTKTTPMLRQAPVTAAGAIWMRSGHAAYVVDVYANLVNLNSGDLPPIGKSFLRQCMEAATSGRKPVGYDLFSRAFKVFDPANADVRKVQLRDPAFTVDIARNMVLTAMDATGVTLDAKASSRKSGKKPKK